MTGQSEHTVGNILREYKRSNGTLVDSNTTRAGNKRRTVDNFTRVAVRNKIHEFYNPNEDKFTQNFMMTQLTSRICEQPTK